MIFSVDDTITGRAVTKLTKYRYESLISSQDTEQNYNNYELKPVTILNTCKVKEVRKTEFFKGLPFSWDV